MEWWHLAIGWTVSMLGGGASGNVLKHLVFDRPKVRIRASVNPRSVARMEPVIEFRLTNERKDEVHISAIKVVRKGKEEGEEETHAFLTTTPSKDASFRLRGLEQETLKATWEDIFPDGPENGCGIDDVTEFYVENIATEKRWKLPAKDLKAIRDGVRETLAYRRGKVTWTLACRSCEKTTSWQARPPSPNGSFCFGFAEDRGWTGHKFPDQYPVKGGTALCPECTAKTSGSKESAA